MSSYKGAMANYYHEARAQVKKIKVLQEENKRRAERRAEIIDPVAPNPLQQLRISGMSCKLLRSADAHAINESGENLVPWNGQQDNMIDRFDVRALLDFYKEPDPRVLAARQKTHEETKLEEILRFESYRDLVRLMSRGLSEPQGLKAVEQDVLNRRAAEHAAMQAATDQVYYNKPGAGAAASGPGTSDHLPVAAGTGMYSAMGFSYDSGPAGAAGGGAAAAAGADLSSDDDSDDSDLDDNEEEATAAAAAGPVSEADLAQEAEDERIDDMAEAFGLSDFSYRLHKSLEKEGEEEARMRKRPKKRMSRKKAANRAKRMAGMGLDPATGLPLRHHDPYKDPCALINPWQDSTAGDASPDRPGHRRGSPSYDAGGWRTRDRSASPARAGERQYITEFVSFGDAQDNTAEDYRRGGGVARAGIIEALPDRPDPAQLGGIQPVARGVMTLQGIKREDLHKRLRQAAEDDSPTYRRRSPTPPWRKSSARSRSRSRGRSRSRDRRRDRSRSVTPPWRTSKPRSRSRSLTPPWRKSSKARSRSRSRSRNRHKQSSYRDRDRKGYHRSRSRSHSRSRSRSRDRYSRDKRRSSDDGGKYNSSRGERSSYSGSGAAAAAARGSRAGATVGGGSDASKGQAGAAAAAAAAGAQKETPQERLKRLMQAQLNKAAQKDSLANAQKKIQAEKDKVAREQIERVALAAGRRRSPSPGARDRSRSPPRYRSS